MPEAIMIGERSILRGSPPRATDPTDRRRGRTSGCLKSDSSAHHGDDRRRREQAAASGEPSEHHAGSGTSPSPAAVANTRHDIFARAATAIRSGWRRLPAGPLLVAPAVLFLLAFFILPILQMVLYSITARMDHGAIVPGPTLENYVRLVRSDLYWLVMVRTLRIALLASLISIPFAYPLALVMARGSAFWSRAMMFVVISPLLVLVVVRAYGWKLILAKQGFLNWTLKALGLADAPPALLYTEWAVVIASVHVFLPFLVLPLASAIGKIAPSVEEAARTLGADSSTVFRRVVMPLSLPGLTVGVTLVFSLTAASYLTPQILGGNFSAMLGVLVQQQIIAVNDWPFGAALATLLLALTLTANLVFLRIVERKFRRWTFQGGER
jgi:putative spermidine/putrescine transport system permease protein